MEDAARNLKNRNEMAPQDIIRDYINNSLLSGNEIGNDDELLLSGLLDSLSVVKLIAFMEDEFDVSISAADVTIEMMESVTAIVSFLESNES